jgi:uncharacterized protein
MNSSGGSVLIRAYGALNDFLACGRRQVSFGVRPGLPCPAVHAVQAAGIPHTEVELLLVNGVPSGFDAEVDDGDRISVYPFTNLRADAPRLRPPLPSPPAFALDVHLGKLARILRLIGMDAAWPGRIEDVELARISVEQGRVLLTRDRELLRRKAVVHGYAVRESDPVLQAKEVMGRFELGAHCRPFTRCSRCGRGLQAVTMEDVLDRLKPLTRIHYNAFWRCEGCGRIYWAGSHLPSLIGLLAQLGLDPGTQPGKDLAGRAPGR